MGVPILRRLLPMPMPLLLQLLLLLAMISSTTVITTWAQSPSPEAASLVALKNTLHLPVPDPLPTWSTSPTSPPPCNTNSNTPLWSNILCERGSVIGINLGNLNLSGTIDVNALKPFLILRSIYFSNNDLSGPMPPFSELPALKAIYISNNSFSGSINDDFFEPLNRIKKVWFDGNAFSGPIPSSVKEATTLLELHLENNQFSGSLPDVDIPSLNDFNVAGNKLTGPIPPNLAKKNFGPQSFQGNKGLCGPPLTTPCSSETIVKGDDTSNNINNNDGSPPPTKQGISGLTIIIIIILVVTIAFLVGIAFVRSRNRDIELDDNLHIETDAEAVEAAAAVESSCQNQYTSNGGSTHQKRGTGGGGGGCNRSTSAKSAGGGGGGGRSVDLVMVNEEKGVFVMSDLMKAAAEVLGNGGLGSAYKATMRNGAVVAVKRTRELNRVGKDVFDGELRKYGRLRHRNVLPPLAYHFRKEEKLVVNEYIARGSLLYILHGDRAAEHQVLDWPTRLKIIRGLARGMAFLHVELANLVVPHANLKSGNVLLDHDFEPLLVDYGFISLINPSQAENILFAYKSPEARNVITPKSDVYCLGIIFLEILTGKFPAQYLNNAKGGIDVVKLTTSALAEQREVEVLDPSIMSTGSSIPVMVRLLKVGVACTEANPEERPEMKEVAELVEEIAASASSSSNQEWESLPDQAAMGASIGL